MRFLIAVLNRDLICKHRTSSEVDLIDSTMDIVWLGNGNSENIYKFREVYLDQNSSPYFIINKVDVTSDQDEQRRFYVIDQSDVDKLERELKGEPGSDIESDSNSNKDEDEDEWEVVQTRSGRSTTRPRLHRWYFSQLYVLMRVAVLFINVWKHIHLNTGFPI